MKLKKKISIATDILKKYGADEIYVFGSSIDKKSDEAGDLGLAVRGLPDELYFKAGGEIMLKLNIPVDIIDLNEDTPFTKYLFILLRPI